MSGLVIQWTQTPGGSKRKSSRSPIMKFASGRCVPVLVILHVGIMGKNTATEGPLFPRFDVSSKSGHGSRSEQWLPSKGRCQAALLRLHWRGTVHDHIRFTAGHHWLDR